VPDPRIHFETLPNGLVLLLREARSVPVASLQIWTRVGSADERPHEAGLAHFHEHMLFKGTERRGVGEIAGEVEGLGGQINAYTTFDATVYYATLPSDSLAEGLDVLVDAVRRSTFDAREVEREIGVVLEEIHRSHDSPWHVIGDAVFAECYHVHPYRAPILGTEASVSSITRERLLDFFRRWYAPDRFVVVAAGDFDAGELAREVKAAFADAEPAGTTSARPVEPPQTDLRTVLLERDFERSSLDLSWCITALADPDTPYLDLLGFVLGEGDSSRLVRHVKEREGLADRIDASCYTPLEPGLFSVTADVDGERVAGCLEGVAREVEMLRQAPPGVDELEKARTNFLASEHFERESVSGMAGKLGSFHVFGGDFRLEQRYMDAIRTATPEDLQRVAVRYLGPERLTAGVLRNASAASTLTEKDVRDAIERGARSAAASASRRRVTPAPAPRPAAAGPRTRAAAGLASYELGGGVRLHVSPRHDVPVVGVRAALRGGLLAESRATSGITQLTTELWLRGTRERSAAELARDVEHLAADLDGFAGRNSLGLTLDVTSDRLEAGLDLFAEVLLAPAFDPEEIERQRRDTLAAIARREDRLGVRAFDLLQAALYRDHPYGLPVVGTAESVAALDRASLVEHHARLVRAPNLVVGVAGDVEPEHMAEWLAARLAELSPSTQAIAEPPEEPGPDETREIELRKDREQAHLALGFRGLTVADPDRHALEVLAQLLAGQGGRLFLELRDRKSLAYSVSAMNVEGLAPGFFATYIATSPERLDEARAGMVDELQRTLDAPPDAAALDRARRYLIGSHLIDGQRSGSRALHVALDSLYGLGPDWGDRYAEAIASVTAEDVLRVARRVVRLDRAVVATIRP
jgi:zinc protease